MYLLILVVNMISTLDPIGLMHMRVSNAKVNRIICREVWDGLSIISPSPSELYILVNFWELIFRSTHSYNHSHWRW